LGDLDGDGDDDVIYLPKEQGTVLWRERQWGWHLPKSAIDLVPALVEQRWLTGDVDADGEPELLLSIGGASQVSFVDLDGDEDADLAVGRIEIGAGREGGERFGRGAQDAPPTQFTVDLDGDGRLDRVHRVEHAARIHHVLAGVEEAAFHAFRAPRDESARQADWTRVDLDHDGEDEAVLRFVADERRILDEFDVDRDGDIDIIAFQGAGRVTAGAVRKGRGEFAAEQREADFGPETAKAISPESREIIESLEAQLEARHERDLAEADEPLLPAVGPMDTSTAAILGESLKQYRRSEWSKRIRIPAISEWVEAEVSAVDACTDCSGVGVFDEPRPCSQAWCSVKASFVVGAAPRESGDIVWRFECSRHGPKSQTAFQASEFEVAALTTLPLTCGSCFGTGTTTPPESMQDDCAHCSGRGFGLTRHSCAEPYCGNPAVLYRSRLTGGIFSACQFHYVAEVQRGADYAIHATQDFWLPEYRAKGCGWCGGTGRASSR
jgi:hypothetical protein